MRRRLLTVAAAAALLASLSGCLTGCDGDSDNSDKETLTVFAAASLTDTFTTLEKRFEEAHPHVDVRLSFGGSSDLVTQVNSGAPADVLASADERTMAKLEPGHTTPRVFATNVLEIAVPPGNPARITTLRDLAGKDVRLVTCAPEVPCGAATQRVADAAGLRWRPVSEEQSVTDVLGKVSAGEADAGLVYVTDVAAAGDDVDGVRFPQASRAVNRYPITTLDGDHEALAKEFVALVTGDEGQRVLRRAGFGAP